MADSVYVKICGYCQKEQNLDAAMRDATQKGIRFTHGYCKRHYEDHITKSFRDLGFSDEQIKAVIDKQKDAYPDLKEKDDLLKMYKQGIWTPQQLHQVQQSQQPTQPETKPLTESISFKERLQILSGIRSSIKS